jgi:mannose-1-phosphate guanylyltransferase/mannose-6-phosphate isomerase
VNAKNNLIYNKTQLTAFIGVDDLCIINTEDVLLIAHQKDVERVKEILLQLPEGKSQKLRSVLEKLAISEENYE